MNTETGRRDHIHTLRRAHEQRDIYLALGLYDEHARVRLVGHGAPPDAPEVLEGKERIAEYLRKAYLGGAHRASGIRPATWSQATGA
jgi:hypothetical protein